MTLLLIPASQSPDNYKDIIYWEIDMNTFMQTGKFQGWMYYNDEQCLATADTDENFYVSGLIIEKCNVDNGWKYAKVINRDKETGDPLSIAGPDGTELVFYEEWEVFGESEPKEYYDEY